MDREIAVNRVLRDMRQQGLIARDEYGVERTGEARVFLNALWAAGYDYYRINEISHNKRKVNYFSKEGKLLNTFNSIEEAARLLKIGRGTIDDILYKKSKGRRNTGNYFRYADNGQTTNKP